MRDGGVHPVVANQSCDAFPDILPFVGEGARQDVRLTASGFFTPGRAGGHSNNANTSSASGNNSNSTGGRSGKSMKVNDDMPPEMREQYLAIKAVQKHAQRLADPEPEKLDVPQETLADVFYAAREVMYNANGTTNMSENDGPRARRREIWGGNNTQAMSPPPPSHRGPAYEEIQQGRQNLPAFAKKANILEAINNNQVVVISGETGCGKTTQVPQFLMDQFESIPGVQPDGSRPGYNIICTQPRRISAIGVAERVAVERGEIAGGTVGYQIRLERRVSDHTRLLFVTTGILLRRLQADPQLDGVTHVILDEVHERTVDSDFLIIILRDLVQRRKDLRLILMSATLNAELFSDYFDGAPKLNIPGYTFPVQEFYLEDALELTRTQIMPTVNRQGRIKRKPIGREQFGQKVMKLYAELPRGCYSRRTLESLAMYDESEVPLDVIIDLVQYIHTYEGDGAILIFLSGWEEISAVHDKLEMLPHARHWRLYTLHSQMPTNQQRDVFLRPPRGIRKIVIATNIAESSITIDDVVYVIDGGKHKEKSYDPEAKVQSLLPAWVSQASSKQRRGRAGRVQPGRCWHIFPRSKLAEMNEYQLPEIVRTSLESLCLQVRHLGLAVPGPGGVAAFIQKALTPPGEAALDNALTLLTRIGAFRTDESLTPLGKHLALLPVEPQIGKALVFGCLLGCLDPVLTIAALLSQRNPFVMPMAKKEQADQAKRRFAQGEPSDHLCLYNAYEAWRQCLRRDQPEFCHLNFLSPSALRTASDVRSQFYTLLQDAGLIPRSREQLAELNRHSEMPKYWPVVRAALSAGLYPNLVRVDYGKKKFKLLSADHSSLNPHPSSVTAEGNPFTRRWAYYHEMCRTPGGLFIYDLTEASPLSLLLFGAGDPASRGRPGALIHKLVSGPHIQGTGGGKKKKGKKKGQAGVPTVGPFAGVEPWVYFNVSGDQNKRMLEEIRCALEYVVGEHVGGARSSESETRLIDTVAQALIGEEELANASKSGDGRDRSPHPHSTMQGYNVDADEDYEFHRSGPVAGEYHSSGPGVYRSFDTGGPNPSRSSYSTSMSGGGYSGAAASSGGRGLPSYNNSVYGGSNSGESSGSHNGGFVPHHQPYRARSHTYGAGGGSGGETSKDPSNDACYATAQAAVAAALGHGGISGNSSIGVRPPPAGASYGNFPGFGNTLGTAHHVHRSGSGGSSGMLAGGSPRFNVMNGDASGSYQMAEMTESNSGSQPRPVVRTHECTSNRTKPSCVQSVSTSLLGGGFHNYAVPHNGVPIESGGGGGVGGHYTHRNIQLGLAEEEDRDRNVYGGYGDKRGRW